MKKLFSLMFVFIFGLVALTACGNDDNGEVKEKEEEAAVAVATTAEEEVEDEVEEPAEEEEIVEIDYSTIDGFLAQLSLEELDIRPTGTDLGPLYIEIIDRANANIFYDCHGFSGEQKEAWIQSVVDLTEELSDDGIALASVESDEALDLSQIDIGKHLFTVHWVYRYNDEMVSVTFDYLGGMFDVNLQILG